MKCRRGGVAQRADARHRVAGKLRQRLAAEARAAGAEDDDVGGAFARAAAAGVADAGEVVTRLRQAQQRQAAVGMARAQAIERGLGAVERVGRAPCRQRRAARRLFQRAVDGLDDWHARMR